MAIRKLTVALKRDGTVKSVDVIQSSGHKLLDDAAIRIVHLSAAVSGRFRSMKKVDELYITRTWEFLPGDIAAQSLLIPTTVADHRTADGIDFSARLCQRTMPACRMRYSSTLSNHFLIAMPGMRDPELQTRSRISYASTTMKARLGILVNRLSGIPTRRCARPEMQISSRNWPKSAMRRC